MTIIKKFDPDQYSQKFPKKYIVLVSIGLIILTLAEIWVSNTVISFGEKFENMVQVKQALKLEKQLLENEIAKYSSLNSVASQSAALGFSRYEKIQYIR